MDIENIDLSDSVEKLKKAYDLEAVIIICLSKDGVQNICHSEIDVDQASKTVMSLAAIFHETFLENNE